MSKLQNGAPNPTLIAKTSNPIAAYRTGLNNADWALSRSTRDNANPESRFKLNPSLWSQARGLLPNILVIPTLNLNAHAGSYSTNLKGAQLQRANIQVSFVQSISGQ